MEARMVVETDHNVESFVGNNHNPVDVDFCRDLSLVAVAVAVA